MVLYAHGQCVDKDGNHDASVEISAAHYEFQLDSESHPAALQQLFPRLKHLRIAVTGTSTLARGVSMARVVAMAGDVVPMMLFFRMLVRVFTAT